MDVFSRTIHQTEIESLDGVYPFLYCFVLASRADHLWCDTIVIQCKHVKSGQINCMVNHKVFDTDKMTDTNTKRK